MRNHRKYCFTILNILLICCLIFGSTVFVFASTDVNITNSSNVSSVDSNGNVVGGGTVSFSSWMQNISYNLARSLSEAMESNVYLSNIWSTMNNATYGTLAQGIYLLNIKDTLIAVGGQVGDVSSKLVTTNGYLATSDASLNSIKNSMTSLVQNTTINKNSATSVNFLGLSTDNVNYSLNNASGDIVYAKVNFTLVTPFQNADSIIVCTLPITPNLVSYVELVDLYDSNAVPDLFLCDFNSYATTFYLRLYNGFTPSSFIFAFHMKEGSSLQQRVKYVSTNASSNKKITVFYQDLNNFNIEFYNLLSDLYTVKNSKLLEEQTDAIKSLANEFNGTNGIVQDDSDTVIVVDFDTDMGEDISGFITTVKHLFDTGVSIGELTVVLNAFSHMPWFTSVETYNTVNSQGAYYKDLYND